MQHRGLTLKELLVAVAIIALLIGLLFPIMRIVRYRNAELRCRANLMAIMAKYQELLDQHGGDRWKARRELNFWIQLDPEGRKVGFCPLGRNGYGHYRVVTEERYSGFTSPDELVPCRNPSIVAYCMCHLNPQRPTNACEGRHIQPTSPPILNLGNPEELRKLTSKFLCVYENGQIGYDTTLLPHPVRFRDCPTARLAPEMRR